VLLLVLLRMLLVVRLWRRREATGRLVELLRWLRVSVLRRSLRREAVAIRCSRRRTIPCIVLRRRRLLRHGCGCGVWLFEPKGSSSHSDRERHAREEAAGKAQASEPESQCTQQRTADCAITSSSAGVGE
jgi:hypothetical protein